MASTDFAENRRRMVKRDIARRGITNPGVLAAMGKVPREVFVPEKLLQYAYHDLPLPIGEGQTISQPYIVALMMETAGVKTGDRVLEIGTGSGYSTAALAEVGCEVFTIDRHADLVRSAAERLRRLGYRGVEFEKRRRHAGLAGGSAVRCDHRDGGRSGNSGHAVAAVEDRRVSGHPGWEGRAVPEADGPAADGEDSFEDEDRAPSPSCR